MSFSFERARQSLRLLTRHKRFTALAILSLGIAIALNTTMYSVMDTMVSPKLAMHRPEQLYVFTFYGDFRRLIPQTEKNAAYRDGFTWHSSITGSVYASEDRVLERNGEIREGKVYTVAPNYFQVLGVKPSAGRLLSPADVGIPARPVVLSERMWKQLFPEKKEFEPSTFYASGEARTVVGLVPFEADFPGRYTDMWQMPVTDRDMIPLGIARMKDGITRAHADAELEAMKLRFGQRTGEIKPKDAGFIMWPATRPPFRVHNFHFALVGAVLAVLLIACANLANLQLARGVSRARELATRAAVGASRLDIIAQLTMESAWLALGGLALGAVLTAWGMKLVDANVPPSIQDYVTHTQVSWRVLVVAAVATLVALILAGLAPSIKVSRVNIEQVLKSGAGTGKTKTTRQQYGALVVLEVALALAVLCSTSLLVRAAYTILSFESGVDNHGLIFSTVAFSSDGPADRRNRQQWADYIVDRTKRVEGVVNAAVSRGIGSRAIQAVDVAGVIVTHKPKESNWGYSLVSSEYMRTMRIPIVAGRDFSVNESAEPGVIIDRRTARLLWPGADPLGRMVRLDTFSARKAPWLKVIGVAGSTRDYFASSDVERARQVEPGLGAVYVLLSRDTVRIAEPAPGRRFASFFSIVARTEGSVVKFPLIFKRGMTGLGKRAVVGNAMTWDQRTGVAGRRDHHAFIASLFSLFGVMALALAALGVYSIIAHMVAQREREFGVRIAIGAGSHHIRELVVREGTILTLVGIAVGLIMTWFSTGLVRAFVFDDWDRYDSRVFAVVALGLFGVAWLASYIPARRAMRIDPVASLRND